MGHILWGLWLISYRDPCRGGRVKESALKQFDPRNGSAERRLTATRRGGASGRQGPVYQLAAGDRREGRERSRCDIQGLENPDGKR